MCLTNIHAYFAYSIRQIFAGYIFFIHKVFHGKINQLKYNQQASIMIILRRIKILFGEFNFIYAQKK